VSTGDGRPASEWPSFVQHLAEVSQTPADEIKPDAEVMRGLGLDSLALAQLIVALREAYESPSRQIQLDSRNWQTITVAQLFEDFTGSRVPARRH
jgi:acyl carrier protein